MSYIGKTILITGGTGYIGSLLVESFNSIDCTVIVSTDDVSSKSTWEDVINNKVEESQVEKNGKVLYEKYVETVLNDV